MKIENKEWEKLKKFIISEFKDIMEENDIEKSKKLYEKIKKRNIELLNFRNLITIKSLEALHCFVVTGSMPDDWMIEHVIENTFKNIMREVKEFIEDV